MNPISEPLPTETDRNPKSTVIRVVFFLTIALAGSQILPAILYATFGLVVAGTVGLFATGLAANLLTMRIFDRRPLVDIGLGGGPASGRNLLLGIGLGAGTAVCMLGIPLAARAGHFVPNAAGASVSWPSLAFYLMALLFGAAGEEMIFRGYAFQLLVERVGPYATVLPVAVIFGLAHSWNPAAGFLSIFNTVLWGVLLGYSFLRSRDLWLPIGLHYGWNAALPLMGVNLSGLTIVVTRYSYKWDLTPLWSGGSYGPEGGLLATIFIILLFLVLTKVSVAPQFAAIARSLNSSFWS